MKYNYNLRNLLPYINWAYFYHAWKVQEGTAAAQSLKDDALQMLKSLAYRYEAYGIVEMFNAYSENDDIVLTHPSTCPCPACQAQPSIIARLPMLRQQTPNEDGYCLCLSDYIIPKGYVQRPLSNVAHPSSTVGLFAASVSEEMQSLYADDEYKHMLVQTLSDRLAEAAAERLHEHVRKTIWGYAANENLSEDDLKHELFDGIRPAVGYPCLPDISLNFMLDRLIDFSQIGVHLTEHGMMNPHASVSGLMIAHPQARYFSIGRITEEQLCEYAKRRGMEVNDVKKYLQNNIGR